MTDKHRDPTAKLTSKQLVTIIEGTIYGITGRFYDEIKWETLDDDSLRKLIKLLNNLKEHRP